MGKKLIVICLVLSACTPMKLRIKQVNFNEGYTTIVSNPYLSSFVLFGDYKIDKNYTNYDACFKKIRTNLPLTLRQALSEKNLLGGGKTTVDPIFYFKSFFLPGYSFKNLDLLFKNELVYRKSDTTIRLVKYQHQGIGLSMFFKENYLGVFVVSIIANNITNANYEGEIESIYNLNVLKFLKEDDIITRSIKEIKNTFIPNYLAAIKYFESQENQNELNRFNSLLSLSQADSSIYLNDSISNTLKGFTALNAKKYIASTEQRYDVIAINENHYNLENRIFLTQLLYSLKKNGSIIYSLRELRMTLKLLMK